MANIYIYIYHCVYSVRCSNVICTGRQSVQIDSVLCTAHKESKVMRLAAILSKPARAATNFPNELFVIRHWPG
jgi:hypothetical protein